jgi:hypothetical protein
MSTLVTGSIRSNTLNPPLFQDTFGTEIGTLCRAWVNFNGTGTVAIRASYNVSSITDNGTGDYTVNFTTALVDESYISVFGYTVLGSSNGGSDIGENSTNVLKTTTQLRILSIIKSSSTFNAVSTDASIVNVAIFR